MECNWDSWKRGIRYDCGIPNISASHLSLPCREEGKDKMPASLALAELCLQTPGKGLISQAQPVLLRAGIQTSQLLSFSQGGSSALLGHLLNPISQSIQQATKKPGTKASTHSCPKKPLGFTLLSGSTSHLVASSNILLLAFQRANVVNSPNQLQSVGTASMIWAATSLPCP